MPIKRLHVVYDFNEEDGTETAMTYEVGGTDGITARMVSHIESVNDRFLITFTATKYGAMTRSVNKQACLYYDVTC